MERRLKEDTDELSIELKRWTEKYQAADRERDRLTEEAKLCTCGGKGLGHGSVAGPRIRTRLGSSRQVSYSVNRSSSTVRGHGYGNESHSQSYINGNGTGKGSYSHGHGNGNGASYFSSHTNGMKDEDESIGGRVYRETSDIDAQD